MGTADAAISVRDVWKVFGPRAERIVNSPEADLPRAELEAATGCVVAVRDEICNQEYRFTAPDIERIFTG